MSEWNNALILEFIHNYETEPIIWDPRHKGNKQKKLVNDAWKRLISNLSFKTTIDDIKKKRDSLMAYYRIHSNKIKKAKQENEVYQTQWFAFEAMNSFLGPIYECNQSINTIMEERGNDSSPEDEWLSSSSPTTLTIRAPSETQEMTFSKKKKRNSTNTVQTENKGTLEMNEIIHHTDKVGASSLDKDDEYDLFGKIIACKLRKISNPMDREIVMNEMMTLAFNALYKPEIVRNNSMVYQDLYSEDASKGPNNSVPYQNMYSKDSVSIDIKFDPLNNMSPETSRE